MVITVKHKLLAYLLISALSFSYLLLAERAGVSVAVFVGIQFVCLYFLVPAKKPLLMFAPLFILGLNAFISANTIWRASNLPVAAAIYSVMALWLTGRFSTKGPMPNFIFQTLKNMIEPFRHFKLPLTWCTESHKMYMGTVKSIAIGVGLSIPCLIFLLAMLSSADAIFAVSLSDFVANIAKLVRIDTFLKALLGVFAGFYLFGTLYGVGISGRHNSEPCETEPRNGDTIILNIVLLSVLLIYTIFVFIQFRYLFASSGSLPHGLTYVTYARRGFFELMVLTSVNIVFILISVWLTKHQRGLGARFTKALCLYLCAVTVVLLISSFYRMWLYGSDDGLTRLRFLVFGFLMFKALGLAATFAYIINPGFNILAVYALIALTYYLILNIAPMDAIVAKSQIDRYLKTGRGGIEYVLSLSPDASSQVLRLLESSDVNIRAKVMAYYEYNDLSYTGWRQWNISVDKHIENLRSLK